MASLTYTENREAFERQMFREPPHAARLSDHASRYIGKLDNTDREALLTDASEKFWDLRNEIKVSADILKTWIKALEFAARRRPRWHCWSSGYDWWVKASQLGSQS